MNLRSNKNRKIMELSPRWSQGNQTYKKKEEQVMRDCLTVEQAFSACTISDFFCCCCLVLFCFFSPAWYKHFQCP